METGKKPAWVGHGNIADILWQERWYEVKTFAPGVGCVIVAMVRSASLGEALTRLRADDPCWMGQEYTHRVHYLDVGRCRCRPVKSLYFWVGPRKQAEKEKAA